MNINDYLSKKKQECFVISELTKREIKRKYVRSYLGVLWSLLNPLLYMVVMTVLFSTMFSRSIENYPVYYLTGYLVWELFSQSTSQMMTVLVDNRQLMLTVRLSGRVLALSRCFTAIVNFVLSLIPYALLLMFSHISASPTMLLLVPGLFFCILFSIGMGYMLSILYVFFADIQYLYTVLLTLWMYLSAIFYPIDSVPEPLSVFISNNPIYVYITYMRSIMLYGSIPDTGIWIRMIIWGMGMYLVGISVYSYSSNKVLMRL